MQKIKKQILIGTHNPTKRRYYQLFFSEWSLDVFSLEEYPQIPIVEEDLFDVVGNSIKKATQYAEMSGVITLSDDTAIYIEALNNEPGVAVRRWAGQLPEEISDEEWLDFLKKKLLKIPGPIHCRKLQVITLADPHGNHKSFKHELLGEIRLKNDIIFLPGGPFSGVFFLDQFQKYESELDEEEIRDIQNTLKRNIEKCLFDDKFLRE